MPAMRGGATLGISVLNLTEQDRIANGLPVRRGALITAVRPGSPADRAGLPIGGVVVAIDGRRVDSADDLVSSIRAAQPGQEIELTYYQGDRLARKSVTLAPAAGSALSAGPAASMPPAARPGADRSLLGRVERMVDDASIPRLSTVYDPREMADLQQRVNQLAEQLQRIEARLKAIEGQSAGPAAGAPGGTTP